MEKYIFTIKKSKKSKFLSLFKKFHFSKLKWNIILIIFLNYQLIICLFICLFLWIFYLLFIYNIMYINWLF